MPMPTPVFADPPELCGHRGSGRGIVAGARENTLASFRAAAEAGIAWVEVDARPTAARVAELLLGSAPRRRRLVTSFDPAALLIVRERAPDVPLGLLTWVAFP